MKLFPIQYHLSKLNFSSKSPSFFPQIIEESHSFNRGFMELYINKNMERSEETHFKSTGLPFGEQIFEYFNTKYQ